MSRMIFVNLPVADLTKSVDFFSQLGFTFEPQFTDENATCMVVSEQACVMLLVRDFFASFTSKQLCDTATHTEVLLAVSAASRQEVDSLADRALEIGARPARPAVDEPLMYLRSFEDLDGHIWEICWMDPSALPQ